MKWITRERPKVDRLACAWLIKRFVDPEAEILFSPARLVMDEAQSTGATPFDLPGVELGHSGPLCSFDAILGKYGLDDPALKRIAHIVRGADTRYPDLADEAAGLQAIAVGLNASIADDYELLAQGQVLYDALYAWCARPVRVPPGLLGALTRFFKKGRTP
jgi:hypothetical protein